VNLSDRLEWLQRHTPFGSLSLAALEAIAAACRQEQIAANRRLVLEDQAVTTLYILKSGQFEAYHTTTDSPAQVMTLPPGTVLHWPELVLDQPTPHTVITLSDCEVWTLSRDVFNRLADQFPELRQSISQHLSGALADVTAQLAYEQQRQMALRPYLVPRVKQGIVGSSRYAIRLRHAIKEAAGDRHSVLIFGEPGLEKDNIAALIHYGSRDRRQPLIQLNCGTLSANGAELFGKAGGKQGLLDWLNEGTLILNNVHEWPNALYPQLRRLLQSREYLPVSDTTTTARLFQGRIILIAEKKDCNCQDLVHHIIRVPPLRVTKADIEALVNYYITLCCRSKRIPKPRITPEALRRLQSYDFPGNLRELASLVERAILQANGASLLTEEVFWPEQVKQRRFRWNLLNAYPQLRYLLRSPWWPDRLNYGLTLWAFPLIVAIGLWGPQDREHNLALNLFWAWWWPLSLLIFPFLGRIWCAVCPFMIYGELLQTLSLKLWPRRLGSWPRPLAEKWGGWILFALFTAILLWEELWDLPNTAYLSSWLLILITAGAVIFSQLYERRFWCRYLCPIGGMNGLFAKLSIIELRAQRGICAASCTTYQCYKGGPALGEGQETGGCPIYSHPAQLTDNRNCVLCMTCLKACPHRSVELNLRPPAIELWTSHTPTAYEVCLLFLLLGAVVLHHLPQVLVWCHQPQAPFLVKAAIATLTLAVPGAIAWVLHQGQRLWGPPQPFIRLAYGYLPLVLGANLAYYLPLGLGEAGHLWPVTLATFGLSAGTPFQWSAHPAVVAFLQTTALIVSTLASLLLTQKISRLPLSALWPQCLGIVGTAVMISTLVSL